MVFHASGNTVSFRFRISIHAPSTVTTAHFVPSERYISCRKENRELVVLYLVMATVTFTSSLRCISRRYTNSSRNSIGPMFISAILSSGSPVSRSKLLLASSEERRVGQGGQ